MLLDFFPLEYPSSLTDTHDGGWAKKNLLEDDSKEKTRVLLAREQQKVADRELLRKQLKKARFGDEEEVKEVVNKVNKQIVDQNVKANVNNVIPVLNIALEALQIEIDLLHHQIALETKRLRDEDDAKAILLLLNAPFLGLLSNKNGYH